MITLTGSEGEVHFNNDGTRLVDEDNTDYSETMALDLDEWRKAYPGETPTDQTHDILDFGWYDNNHKHYEPDYQWRKDLVILKKGTYWEYKGKSGLAIDGFVRI